MKTSIAILMATYNGEQYIQEQLDSIIQQTYTNWMLYINDDNSSDHTPSILQQYRNEYPNQIIIMNNNSGRHGATENFVDLFSKVQDHSYYAFCDQDDYWETEKLEMMLQTIQCEEDKQTEPLLVYCTMNITDQNRNLLSTSLEEFTNVRLGDDQHFLKLLLANYVPGCAMLFNKALKDVVNVYPETIELHDWWIMLLCAAFGRIVQVKGKALGNYRQHSNNTLGVQNTQSVLQRILNNMNPNVLKLHIAVLTKCRRQAIHQVQALLDHYSNQLSEQQLVLAKHIRRLLTSRNRVKSVLQGLQYPYLGNTFYERFTFWWFIDAKR